MASWQKRLMKDIQDLRENGFELLPEGGPDKDLQLDCFQVGYLSGPKETPYANGRWRVRFTVSSNFPFQSPSVGIVEHIMHPNIDWTSGSVCLDALNKKWSPVFTLRHIMETLLPYLLSYPNAADPLNREAAALLNENPSLFAATASDATNRHAKTPDAK